jgi:hypothetical protein
VIAPQSELATWRERIARFDRQESMVTLNYAPPAHGTLICRTP